MDVSVDASNELPPNIEPPNVLSVVALEVIDDSENAKPEDPPPKVDIPSGKMLEYHIEKNVRAKCKTDCKVKDLKGKDGK